MLDIENKKCDIKINPKLHDKAKYIEVDDKQEYRIIQIRMMFSEIYECIEERCNPSRETSLALTKLEEAQFWAIKGITREKGE